MTLVLEIHHVDGTRSRHQLGNGPLTIGRAVTNDIILDDPYVDATHARLTFEDDGAVVVEDLGTINGLVTRDERLFGRVVARSGDLLRLGRTTIKFRDPSETLPPALRDPANGAPVVQPRRRFADRVTSTSGGLVLATLTTAAFGLNAWLGSSARSSANDAVTAVLGYATLVAVWAGLWSVASRIILHQFRFFGHVAVVSTLVLIAMSWSVVESWLSFFFPDAGVVTALAFLSALALVGALVTGHLSLSSTMSRRRRWRAGFIVSGSLLAITALVSFTKDDTFSDVPKFPAVLKPVAPSLIPTKSIDQFEAVAQDLKTQADQLAKK
jgi:hypothetical protein